MASKFGADSSLLASPVKTKLGCCVLVLVPVALGVPALEEDRNNIHGTATCLPAAPEVLLLVPVGVVAPELLLAVPALVAPAPAFNEMTANSRRPEAGFTMVSLIAPI